METEGFQPRPQGQWKPHGAVTRRLTRLSQSGIRRAWRGLDPTRSAITSGASPQAGAEAERGAHTSPATAQNGSVPAFPRGIQGLCLPTEELNV